MSDDSRLIKPKSLDSVAFRGRFPLLPANFPTGTHQFAIGVANITVLGSIDAKGKSKAISVTDALGVDHGPKALKLFKFKYDPKNQRAVLSIVISFNGMAKGGFDSSGVVAAFGITGKNGTLQALNIQVALLIDDSSSYSSLISAGFVAKNRCGPPGGREEIIGARQKIQNGAGLNNRRRFVFVLRLLRRIGLNHNRTH